MDGVSLCITTFRRPDLLQFCIRSAFDNRTRPLEVVVSDNDFSEASAAAVLALTPPEGIVVRHVANPGPSTPSQNVMNAFAEASHERLILMHDDDFMMPGGVDALAAAWEAHGADKVDAVYGRQNFALADGTLDERRTRHFDARCFRDSNYGPQETKLWAALAQQFPCNGMMVRKSLALEVGYPRETEVGRDPNDFHFGVRYAMAGKGAFIMIDYFVSAYRLSEVSLLRSAYEDRVFDAHLGYRALERLTPSTDRESEARSVALARMAPMAVASYLKAGDRKAAFRAFADNHRRMEKTFLAKMGLLGLIMLDFAGVSVMKRHGANVRRVYDYFYGSKI